jgi:hypothetical protein
MKHITRSNILLNMKNSTSPSSPKGQGDLATSYSAIKRRVSELKSIKSNILKSNSANGKEVRGGDGEQHTSLIAHL